MAIEVMITNGICFVAGEVTTDTYVDVAGVTRKVIREVGYTNSQYGFHWETSGVMVAIKEQSSDIARGVDSYLATKDGKIIKEDLAKLGAGDQGMMVGYACKDTKELMPLPIVLAHRLTEKLAEVRKSEILSYLRPDGKSQVTIEYKNNVPVGVHSIVIAAQHDPNVESSKLKAQITKWVIKPVLVKLKAQNSKLKINKAKIFINTTGRFVIGGPQADTGLTGRKNIVDTYGGVVAHGGGSFSGKDPTKVDRSGQYAARWLAKNIVASGLASRCQVQIAYVIGVPKPMAVEVDTFGTGKISDEKIAEIVRKVFDLRPGIIIKELNLRQPIYQKTACYGHFGRPELDLPWEKLNKVKEIKRYLN